LDKKYGKALESLKKLKELKEEPIVISGQIAKYFCDLSAVHMASAPGSFDYASISKKTGIHEYKVKLTLGSLKRYGNPAAFIDKSLDLCRDCDKKLKSTSLDDYGLIENLICNIAGL
jgi:DNA polymerase III delta subunit